METAVCVTGTNLDKDKLNVLIETVVANLKTDEELDTLIDIVEKFRKVVADLKWYQRTRCRRRWRYGSVRIGHLGSPA